MWFVMVTATRMQKMRPGKLFNWLAVNLYQRSILLLSVHSSVQVKIYFHESWIGIHRLTLEIANFSQPKPIKLTFSANISHCICNKWLFWLSSRPVGAKQLILRSSIAYGLYWYQNDRRDPPSLFPVMMSHANDAMLKLWRH